MLAATIASTGASVLPGARAPAQTPATTPPADRARIAPALYFASDSAERVQRAALHARVARLVQALAGPSARADSAAVADPVHAVHAPGHVLRRLELLSDQLPLCLLEHPPVGRPGAGRAHARPPAGP